MLRVIAKKVLRKFEFQSFKEKFGETYYSEDLAKEYIFFDSWNIEVWAYVNPVKILKNIFHNA